MDIIQEYINQNQWRNWKDYLKYLPLTKNQNILDLGCSVGIMSNILSKSTNAVIGIDLNKDFIEYANKQKNRNVTFYEENITEFNIKKLNIINGIWSSFTLSYLEQPKEYLSCLYDFLPINGWIGLVDISCFISGNMDKNSKYYSIINKFEIESVNNRLYDFNFGTKMEQLLKDIGFIIEYVNNDVTDQELNFDGKLNSKVLLNWQARLERMKGIQNLLKEDYSNFMKEFITYLSNEKHCKNKNVRFVVGRKLTTAST